MPDLQTVLLERWGKVLEDVPGVTSYGVEIQYRDRIYLYVRTSLREGEGRFSIVVNPELDQASLLSFFTQGTLRAALEASCSWTRRFVHRCQNVPCPHRILWDVQEQLGETDSDAAQRLFREKLEAALTV